MSLAQADGTLVFVNTAYARHFGKTPEQMVGLNLFDFVDAAGPGAGGRAIAPGVMASGEGQSNENRMRVGRRHGALGGLDQSPCNGTRRARRCCTRSGAT